jgi:hypothetical protein
LTFAVDVCRFILNSYEHFSKPFKSTATQYGFRAKQKNGGYGILVATQEKACPGLFALPIIFTRHVYSSVRHALRAEGKEVKA